MIIRNLLLMTLVGIIGATLCIDSQAQTNPPLEIIRGEVSLSNLNTILPGIHIWIHEERDRTSIVVQPDQSGKFTAEVSPGYYYVLIGVLGYAPYSKSIWVHHGTPINLKVQLVPDLENMQVDWVYSSRTP